MFRLHNDISFGATHSFCFAWERAWRPVRGIHSPSKFVLLLGVEDKRDRYLVIAKSVLELKEVGIVAVANNAWGSLAYGKRHGRSSRSIGRLDNDEAESRIGQI